MTSSTGAPGRLQEWLERQPAPTRRERLLPLAHTTGINQFKQIVADRRLSAIQCSVMQGPRVYLYYGGAYYKPRGKASRDAGTLPMAMVFRPTVLSSVHAVFPFDTGAVKAGIFGPSLCGRLPLDDSLGLFSADGRKALPALVVALYGSNLAYQRGNPLPSLASEPHPLPTLYELLSLDGKDLPENCDARATAIECQFTSHLELQNHLEAIAIPEECGILAAPLIQFLEDSTGDAPKVVSYAAKRPFNPSHEARAVQSIVDDVIASCVRAPAGAP